MFRLGARNMGFMADGLGLRDWGIGFDRLGHGDSGGRDSGPGFERLRHGDI